MVDLGVGAQDTGYGIHTFSGIENVGGGSGADRITGALYHDADGTGKAAQIKIGQLSKNLKMNAAEFFVV